MIIEVSNEQEMQRLGEIISCSLFGGEIIDLIGDVGTGKTTLTRGIAIGLGVKDHLQSPSFTVSREYNGRDDIVLVHYDFYRLNDPGVLVEELKENVGNSDTVTVIEWSDIIKDILPSDSLSIQITVLSDDSRKLAFSSGGQISSQLLERIKNDIAT